MVVLLIQLFILFIAVNYIELSVNNDNNVRNIVQKVKFINTTQKISIITSQEIIKTTGIW